MPLDQNETNFLCTLYLCAGMEPAQRFFSESKRTLYKVMVEFQSIFHNLNQPGHTEYKTVMNEV